VREHEGPGLFSLSMKDSAADEMLRIDRLAMCFAREEVCGG